MYNNNNALVLGQCSENPVVNKMVMLINQERIAYSGLLGVPARRKFGSITFYVSLGRPFSICFTKGLWEQAVFAVIAPYTDHWITSEDRHIGCVMVELESVDPDDLPDTFKLNSLITQVDHRVLRMRAAFCQRAGQSSISTSVFDLLFFGEDLPQRMIDPRIADVADQIGLQPEEQHDAETSASRAGLSFSRFLHLFTDNLGVSYRRFRAWKRARNLLRYVRESRNLTDIALEMGYPDSSHFSHSIRNTYGLRPKDIFAGSRRLALITFKSSEL